MLYFAMIYGCGDDFYNNSISLFAATLIPRRLSLMIHM